MPLNLVKAAELYLLDIKAHEVTATTGITAQYIFTAFNPLNGSIQNFGIKARCIITYHDNAMIALALYCFEGVNQAFAKGISYLVPGVELEHGRFHTLQCFAGSFGKRIVK